MLDNFPGSTGNTPSEVTQEAPEGLGVVLSFPKPKGTNIPDSKKKHWITIEFDEDQDHYRITSSFKAGPTNFFIDGATVQRRLQDYLLLLWQICEDYRRKMRNH